MSLYKTQAYWRGGEGITDAKDKFWVATAFGPCAHWLEPRLYDLEPGQVRHIAPTQDDLERLAEVNRTTAKPRTRAKKNQALQGLEQILKAFTEAF